ncbi:Epidermal patterning factor-like protein [Heracleum sosnowskyi]|uniref:Epidermal patterning factor-like protein n=1 Tax=Heracleum sosnowskyi TaxID=360622 RepID=A0AAD8HA89_9APIA|nr:Epidermal patterning factor-like protein [Heracleum sosnowskyi]
MASSGIPSKKKMKGERFKFFVVIVVLLHTESCVCVVSSSGRPFFQDYASAVQQPTGTKETSRTSETNLISKKGVMINKLIGSIPPSCEHKCYGCTPCEATQVPTTKSNVEIQSANYQPEGWKCQCGPSFYGP